MSAEIIGFRPAEGMVGAGVHISPDQVLAHAAGDFDELVILGRPKGSSGIELRGSCGAADALWLIEEAKLHLLGMTQEQP